jgi:cysteine desulfurase
MWANNETGVILPVAEVGACCRRRGVPFHTDAVQAAGKVDVDVRLAGPDYLSLSGHKLCAPKGIGALYVRAGTAFHPWVVGGHQEGGRRAGTENVSQIVGLGCAAELAKGRLAERRSRVQPLRDRLEAAVLAAIPRAWVNGAAAPRLPNTSSLGFEAVEAEAVVLALDREGICASSGSACATGSLEPSHVLSAMGLSPRQARGSVRFSLGPSTTPEDVDALLAHLPAIISRLRAMSPRGDGA